MLLALQQSTRINNQLAVSLVKPAALGSWHKQLTAATAQYGFDPEKHSFASIELGKTLKSRINWVYHTILH